MHVEYALLFHIVCIPSIITVFTPNLLANLKYLSIVLQTPFRVLMFLQFDPQVIVLVLKCSICNIANLAVVQ
jgi:hypothetical protein